MKGEVFQIIKPKQESNIISNIPSSKNSQAHMSTFDMNTNIFSENTKN
jgi:hypothetical protein